MKRIAFVIVLFILLYLFNTHIYACTIFTVRNGDTVLVGNNEDFMYQYSSDMWFAAARDESYGRVCFANSHYVQGGMNEKGLFYDGAACPNTQVPYSADKPSLGMDLGEVVLSRCANVDEVVEMLKEYNIPEGLGDHLMFADESGKSVIIEWVENEMKVVPKEKSYQIATNFFISKPELGGFPCSRYATVEKMLEGSKELSVGTFTDILGAVTQKWDGGGTKYSNVYDLKQRIVYVYDKANFDKYAVFHLDEELKKLNSKERVEYNIDTLPYEVADVGKPVSVAADKSVPAAANQNSLSAAVMPEETNHIHWWYVTLPLAGIVGVAVLILRHRAK
jgi:choloylglycine hydrolase